MWQWWKEVRNIQTNGVCPVVLYNILTLSITVSLLICPPSPACRIPLKRGEQTSGGCVTFLHTHSLPDSLITWLSRHGSELWLGLPALENTTLRCTAGWLSVIGRALLLGGIMSEIVAVAMGTRVSGNDNIRTDWGKMIIKLITSSQAQTRIQINCVE